VLPGYTDVHVVFVIVQALRRRGMDVVTAQDRGRQEADDAELLAEALADQRVMLTNDTDFSVPTDHLSDRELYCLIYRDILPAREKKLEHINHYLHWDCTGPSGDPDVWLRFYADEEEREEWADCYGQPLPEREVPPYPRILPRETNQGSE